MFGYDSLSLQLRGKTSGICPGGLILFHPFSSFWRMSPSRDNSLTLTLTLTPPETLILGGGCFWGLYLARFPSFIPPSPLMPFADSIFLKILFRPRRGFLQLPMTQPCRQKAILDISDLLFATFPLCKTRRYYTSIIHFTQTFSFALHYFFSSWYVSYFAQLALNSFWFSRLSFHSISDTLLFIQWERDRIEC